MATSITHSSGGVMPTVNTNLPTPPTPPPVIKNIEIKCPICMELPLYPRLYNCGHTVCEICMKSHDNSEKHRNYYPFSATVYTCPICRDKTLSPWYKRVINRSLQDILLTDATYKSKYDEYTSIRIDIDQGVDIPEDVDLTYLTKQKRKEQVESLYKEILPILLEASSIGQSFITINHRAHEINMVSDLLSEKLFKHNIYKLVSNDHECTIEILPSERRHTCEFENDEYNFLTTHPLPRSSQRTASRASPRRQPVQHSPVRRSPRRTRRNR
jgi:hypothetical protein